MQDGQPKRQGLARSLQCEVVGLTAAAGKWPQARHVQAIHGVGMCASNIQAAALGQLELLARITTHRLRCAHNVAPVPDCCGDAALLDWCGICEALVCEAAQQLGV